MNKIAGGSVHSSVFEALGKIYLHCFTTSAESTSIQKFLYTEYMPLSAVVDTEGDLSDSWGLLHCSLLLNKDSCHSYFQLQCISLFFFNRTCRLMSEERSSGGSRREHRLESDPRDGAVPCTFQPA